MNPMLSDREKETLASILAPFSGQIDQVGVFGSRATGVAKPTSDIDLVIYGNIDYPTEWRLRTLFQESSLPVEVDVVVYGHIKYEPLKRHIDSVALKIFDGSYLRQVAQARRL